MEAGKGVSQESKMASTSMVELSLNCAYSDERLDQDSRIVEEYLIAGANMGSLKCAFLCSNWSVHGCKLEQVHLLTLLMDRMGDNTIKYLHLIVVELSNQKASSILHFLSIPMDKLTDFKHTCNSILFSVPHVDIGGQ